MTDQLGGAVSGPPVELIASDQPAAMVGASRPPFQTDSVPRPHFPSDPLIPRLPVGASELAEALSLPAALEAHEVDADAVPMSVMDARVAFTHLSRKLGRAYREAYRVELRTDLRGLELVQRHLKERFPDGVVEGEDAMRSIRLHGAFVSELISRTLGGEWAELGKDYGHLAMRVPPGVLVWPFGRVLRYVEMQHKERDLVSYYLELSARSPKS